MDEPLALRRSKSIPISRPAYGAAATSVAELYGMAGLTSTADMRRNFDLQRRCLQGLLLGSSKADLTADIEGIAAAI
ncbi:hypothetical protein NKJ55_28565 [Mesorhizobium sp. M0106]|uniref:hypothetical protein n=1 Tax=Mesorhizobium sp. M0106 TaxID=2956880 RepID=UPI0033396EDC